MELYLVGGAVRDEIMGRAGADRDWVVLGAGEGEFLARFPGARQVGRKGITWIWRGEEYTLSDAADIAADLAVRDLTVNALARGGDGRLFAHPRALADIRDRMLRPVAAANFLADPLRVLRAARFAACFPDFAAAPELIAAMRLARPHLAEPAAERAGMELRKACACPAPGRFMALLAEAGCLAPWFAELASPETAAEAGARAQATAEFLAESQAESQAGAPVGESGAQAVFMALCSVLDAAGAEALVERLRLPVPWRRAALAATQELAQLLAYQDLSPGDKAAALHRLHVLKLTDQALAAAAALCPGFPAERARADLKTVLSVRLPPTMRDRGEASGELLARLRAEALAARQG
ncbi:Polynucleotide adenylyltransferase region [Desulfovibrio sp. X2]|uniref:CCA tRNA nucleotidyltransferase n=1 Tax=Desulfovibrio sp. X2 TaxID=941449 RepID=UPI000358DC19|nr:CCA tRNA nucleotidyltransferase [Desulfovibrio sp. X2]EPR44696.1 Polynucleotide adenylyltransferase region [Desulfovibrio sp. X2]